MVQVVPPEEIVVVVNTGDDRDFFGLRVCPDLDIVTYTLAGVVGKEAGWGLEGDTFECLEALQRFRSDTWFRLGDRDLATHVHRRDRTRVRRRDAAPADDGEPRTHARGARERREDRLRGVSGARGGAG
jgi:LPPG:FO 2-phospho-L-lactate transferase